MSILWPELPSCVKTLHYNFNCEIHSLPQNFQIYFWIILKGVFSFLFIWLFLSVFFYYFFSHMIYTFVFDVSSRSWLVSLICKINSKILYVFMYLFVLSAPHFFLFENIEINICIIRIHYKFSMILIIFWHDTPYMTCMMFKDYNYCNYDHSHPTRVSPGSIFLFTTSFAKTISIATLLFFFVKLHYIISFIFFYFFLHPPPPFDRMS